MFSRLSVTKLHNQDHVQQSIVGRCTLSQCCYARTSESISQSSLSGVSRPPVLKRRQFARPSDMTRCLPDLKARSLSGKLIVITQLALVDRAHTHRGTVANK